MANDRAQRGGEMGMNGLHYEGGQFLPNTTLGKLPPKAKRQSTGKVEVAPYVWEERREGFRPIYRVYNAFWQRCEVGFEAINNPTALAAYGRTREEVQSAADRFNAGERWEKVTF